LASLSACNAQAVERGKKAMGGILQRRVNISNGQRCFLSPKDQKWYLLNKLFGLRPSEISELEGINKKISSVRQLIIRTSDQFQAGELSLIEVTPPEKEAAKTRLDTHRKKRNRYNKKKQPH